MDRNRLTTDDRCRLAKPATPRRRAAQLLFAYIALAISPAGFSADHAEAPLIRSDPAADIADIYLFRNDPEDRIIMIMTFSGIAAPNPRVDGPTGNYDPDVVYRFSIDTNPLEDGDGIIADHEIDVRFGQDPDSAEFGIMVENLPGTSEPIIGAVETIIESPEGLRVFAGLRDDPFFFDSIGFGDTLASFGSNPDDGSGQLLFDNSRDTFSNRNITAIVLEMDREETTQGNDQIRVWGSTLRPVSEVSP